MSAYREPGREATELEIIKNQAIEETKRKAIEAREATKREIAKARESTKQKRIESIDTFGYIITRMSFCAVLVGAIIGGYYAYQARIQMGKCRESFRQKSDHISVECDPGQKLVETKENWMCLCVLPTDEKDGGAP